MELNKRQYELLSRFSHLVAKYGDLLAAKTQGKADLKFLQDLQDLQELKLLDVPAGDVRGLIRVSRDGENAIIDYENKRREKWESRIYRFVIGFSSGFASGVVVTLFAQWLMS